MASSPSNSSNTKADPCQTATTTTGASPARAAANTLQAPPQSQFIQRPHQFQQRVITGTSTGKGSESFLASSGIGLLHTRPSLGGCPLTVPNPGVYPLTMRPTGLLFAPSDSAELPHSNNPFHPPYLHPSQVHMSSAPAGIRGISAGSQPQPKVPSSAFFAPDSNGCEDPMNKGTNDIFVSVRDRKVRISDVSSIYGLCRSWLRNGYPEESQLQYGDFIKSLPKPSPTSISESSLTERKESDEIEEDEKSVENLSAEHLLQRHIKRAKRVRARLREERLQRIARYKSRLALLLPPVMEQCGNDTTTGT